MNTALREVATGQAGQKPQQGILTMLDNPRVAKGMAAVAGKFLSPDKMLRLCINAVHKTPDLMKCDPKTVLGAMMASAALDLEPNTVQQQAFLIPYARNKKVGDEWVKVYDCQFQIGARGFRTLAYRSPRVSSIEAGSIRHGDHFKNRIGKGGGFEYEMSLAERGPLIGAWSYVQLVDGGELTCVLPLDEVMKIRGRSETFRALTAAIEKARDDKDRARAEAKLAETPWVMWLDDMAAKSATKKHAKQLPLEGAPQLAVAAGLDDAADAGGLDLGALTDPDLVREVAEGAADAPQALTDDTAGQAERSMEAFGTTQRKPEQVAAEQQQPAKAAEAKKPAAGRAAAPKQEALPKVTYAQLADAITKAKNRDDAAMALDEGRGLPDDQRNDLSALFKRTWPAEG
jgi:recombination protein RecT